MIGMLTATAGPLCDSYLGISPCSERQCSRIALICVSHSAASAFQSNWYFSGQRLDNTKAA